MIISISASQDGHLGDLDMSEYEGKPRYSLNAEQLSKVFGNEPTEEDARPKAVITVRRYQMGTLRYLSWGY